jgi:ABC-2 type transport system ATP-binding protein
MGDYAITADGLTRRFGAVLAVDQVRLAIPRGQIYGFLGPNGSGKSTTIRMLCGLLRPDAGTVTALGLRIPAQADALRHRLGYMTQRFSLWEDLSGRENLRFMAQIHTLPRAAIAGRIQALADEYHLHEFLDRAAGSLSGGQKQRLALAAATVHQPELLLLDEPTSAVDPQSRRDFWDSLFRLANTGTTILVSTHYMDEAERCHALAILNLGRVVAEGSPLQLRERLPLAVIDVAAADILAARAALATLPAVRSVTQLGLRLHALVAGDALAAVRAALAEHHVAATAAHAEAGLEDVFVAATQRAA